MKCIVLSEYKELASRIGASIAECGCTVETSYESLHSIRSIRRSIVETGNTVFLRKAFSRFIQDNGLPGLIALDYVVDLGLDEDQDPDRHKLLRTFLISYVIFLRKTDLQAVDGRFLLIADERFYHEAVALEKKPELLIDMLYTQNQEVNHLLDSIRTDRESLSRIFNIRVLRDDAPGEDVSQAVGALMTGAAASRMASAEMAAQPAPVTTTAPAADGTTAVVQVMYRISDTLLMVNNRPVDITGKEKYRRLAPGQFYVVGTWNQSNCTTVADRIAEAVEHGMGPHRLAPGHELVVNVCELCTIDNTVIAPLVNLFTKTLIRFERRFIHVNFKNGQLMENASGYLLIKQFVRHEY